MRKTIVLCSLALLPAPLAAQIWDRDNYTSPRSGSADARGVTLVDVRARAGTLEIKGVEGLKEVRAKGTARANDEDYLDEIKLRVERHGNRVSVIVDIPERNHSMWNNNVNRGLDLIVEVPKGMDLDVEDSSGELEISNVGALDLDDSSGDIQVDNVGGPLRIEDSSGEIRVTNVRGDVRVDDSSGDINIRDVTGRVVIDDDSSGDIDITDVSGSVEIDNDSSGDIDVRRVGGDFTVAHDGSGSIRHSGIKGEVSVPESRESRRERARRDRRGYRG